MKYQQSFKTHAIVATALFITAGGANAMVGVESSQSFVPGEIVVKLKESAAISSESTVYAFDLLQNSFNAGDLVAAEPFQTDGRMQLVKVKNEIGMQTAIGVLSANPNVEYAEPNYIYTAMLDSTTGVPNDPDIEKLWGIMNTGQADPSGKVGNAGADINVVPLWRDGIRGSSDIKVAVIDTGVDWDHPDLVDNIWTNPSEIDGDGIDNDNNGFIDDIHGWNFAANTNSSDDDHSHGSHCSGTIGGKGDNGIGVSGVNWNVTIVPVKFLTASGSGSLQGAVESINYATKLGVDVMSNSWGGGGFSQALEDAIKASRDAGIVFVAAAGNSKSDNDARPTYPAGYDVDNVIAVAATDNKDAIASFSNWGKSKVHVSAPGVNVWSTVKDGGYASFSGTSMATPHVAGIVALMKSNDRSLDYATIKDRLIKTSNRIRSLKAKSVSKGRVNAYNAINNIVPPNNEPDDNAWSDVNQGVESDHPYESNQEIVYEMQVPGATHIRVHFEKVDTETQYDKIQVISESGEVVDEVTGAVNDYMSEYVEGSKVTIKLITDRSVEGWGFKIDKIQAITP